jgi:signal transduction histidine kinase
VPDLTIDRQVILDSITDQFFALDRDWRFTYFNRHAAAQMSALGKDPARLIGLVLWDEFSDVPDAHAAALRHVMSERVPVIDEVDYAPLGQWLENHLYPSPDGGLVCFQRYITGRKQAEATLRRSQAYLAEAQRLSHCGCGAWNVATGEVFWSDETYHIYGVAPGTTPSADLFFGSVVHPDERLRLQHAFEEAVRDKRSYEVEFRIVHPDGTVRHISSVGRPELDRDGNVCEFVGTVMDVTQQRRIAHELDTTRKRFARVARISALGELNASISHEVNQPLAAIAIDAGACQRWLSREPPNLEEALVTVRRIAQEAERASAVTKRMRALWAHDPVRMDPVQLNELIAEMLALLRSELLGAGVAVRLELSTSLPPVPGDRVLIGQVVMNLIHNAIDAMETVADRPRELVIESSAHGDAHVLVSVRDSGVGIAPDVLDVLFEPLFSTRRGGIGLGLSVSRTIIEQHGGRLWASHNVDHGATLHFRLPVSA